MAEGSGPVAGGRQREEYVARINRVLDHIAAHLDRELTLQVLARVANFSPYHFHRIFGAMMGETVRQYIQRQRIEKAAQLLVANPKRSITGIALDCGFSSSAAFARSFRDTFGMSASQWRSGGCQDNSKDWQTDRKPGQAVGKGRKDFDVSIEYSGDRVMTQRWRIVMTTPSSLEAKVEVKQMPEMHVAYVRHIGPYEGDSELFGRLFGKLFQWAGPRGLLRFPETKLLSVYHDNPEITEADKRRTDVCMTVPEDTKVEGEIGKTTIAGGKYAVARFEVTVDRYGDAWNAVFGGWLPQSGYQPVDGPCFEVYHNDPEKHPEHKHIFDICVPVKPL
jgi:AraC family transcriptional regulator